MKEINLDDHFGTILNALRKGVLITTKAGDRVNPMTISWGQIGIEWNRPIFTTYVRTGRLTHEMLEESGEFTVNIPMEDKAGKILGFCGTKSGRDFDKVKELGLTLVEGGHVDVPGILELPMTLECKVIYSQLQDEKLIPEYLKSEFYPQEVGSIDSGANKDFHTMFMGEIVGAYIAE